MNTRTKYCRYKNYILQVHKEIDDIVDTVTSKWHIGKNLNMVCHDRDFFTKEIPRNEIDCIWTVENGGNFYDSIQIEYGQIRATNYEKQVDLMDSAYVKIGEFASYKNKIYRSYSGYNHSYWFKLTSTDEKTQDIGFIMEEPGIFCKCVNPKEIDFAYQSKTLCNFKSKEFYVVKADQSENFLIQPYDRGIYPQDELLALEFESVTNIPFKWVEPKQTDKIWTITEKIHDFARFQHQDRILFGT